MPEFKVRNQKTVEAIENLKKKLQIKTRTGVIDYLVSFYPEQQQLTQRIKELEKVLSDSKPKKQTDIEAENQQLKADLAEIRAAVEAKEKAEQKIKEICDRISNNIKS